MPDIEAYLTPKPLAPPVSPLKNLLKTSVPAVIDLSSQTIMWTIEAILVGRISAAAFAGLGMAIQVVVVCMTVLLTFVVGSVLIINRDLGAEDYSGANHIFGQAMLLGVLMSLGIAVLWYFGATQIFRLIKEGGTEAREAGVAYLQTIALFAPIIITNFIAIGIIRGVGDTKYSMLVNVSLNVLNLVLAPILIFGWFGLPRLEVQGAALAAGISHTAGFAATCYLLHRRKTALSLGLRELTRPHAQTVKRLFRAGFPTTVEQLVWSSGLLVITSYAAVLGVTVLAAHQVFMRIQAVLSMFYLGFGMGAMTLMGKNLGAEQRKLAERTAEISSSVMFAIVMIVVVLLIVYSDAIIRVFTTDPEVIRMGASIAVWAFAVVQIPKALNNVLMGNLRGAGDLQWLMWLTFAAVLFFEVGLNWAVAFLLNGALVGLWLVHLLDETFKMTANYWRFQRGNWKYFRL